MGSTAAQRLQALLQAPARDLLPVRGPDDLRAAASSGRLKLRAMFVHRAPELVAGEYVREIRAIGSGLAPLVRELVVAKLPWLAAHVPAEMRADSEEVRLDVFAEPLRAVFEGLRHFWRRLSEDKAQRAAGRAGSATADRQRRDDAAQWARMGVRPDLSEGWIRPALEAFTADNVRLIRGLGEDQIDRIQGLVSQGLRTGLRHEELARKLESELRGPTREAVRARAALIARDQVGKLYGELTLVRHRKMGIRRYRWSTSHDERVRQTHAERDGLTFDNDQPIEPQLRAYGLHVDRIDGHPGQPIRCRCAAIPDVADLLDRTKTGAQPRTPETPKQGAPRPRRKVEPKTPPAPSQPSGLEQARARYGYAHRQAPDAIVGKYDHEAMIDALKAEDWVRARDHVRGILDQVGLVDHQLASADNHLWLSLARAVEIQDGLVASHGWDGRIKLPPRTISALKAFGAGGRTTTHWRGLKVLLHEQLHGASPGAPSAYNGVGALVEELTTEALARSLIVQHVPKAPDIRVESTWDVFGEAYDGWFDAAKRALSTVAPTATSSRAWVDALERAAMAYKKLPGGSIARPEDVGQVFGRLLHAELREGSEADVQAALHSAVRIVRNGGGVI